MTDAHTAGKDGGQELAAARRVLADRLWTSGDLRTEALRAGVAEVPREVFLQPGVLRQDDTGRWTPVLPDRLSPGEWATLAYQDESLVTQLDGQITAADLTQPGAEPRHGFPTASSTMPSLVVSMIEELDAEPGMSVLELGTGTGYSTALLTRLLGEDAVTSIEVDPVLAARAEKALNEIGLAPWTYPGDGLLGYPRRAPYDRVIATFSVRRIPYAWVRQTNPGGTILATVGSWAYGTGLAKLTVNDDGTATGTLTRPTSFMPARAHAAQPLDGDLDARTAYADSERTTTLDPAVLDEWMPAFLAQVAASGTQLVHVTGPDKEAGTYLFDTARESYAAVSGGESGWTVRQGGPVAIWDAIETAIDAWENAGRPGIEQVKLVVTPDTHVYTIPGDRRLIWSHRLLP